MKELDKITLRCFKSAIEKLTGYNRRIFVAELSMLYFGGSARKTEEALGVSRDMVKKGLYELQMGIRCVEDFSARGRKKRKGI